MSKTSEFDAALNWSRDSSSNNKKDEPDYVTYALYAIGIIVVIALIIGIIIFIHNRNSSSKKIIIPDMLNNSTNINPKGVTSVD